MAKKGQSKHQKRLSAPSNLKLSRKTDPWTSKPIPGPHSSESCIPLANVIRDYLKITRTAREAKKLLSDGKIKVDGKIRRNPKFPIGFMDVISIDGIEKSWRVMYNEKGYLVIIEIPEEESNFKLVKIEGKNKFKGGKIQLVFHDGKTTLGDFNEISTGDVVKIDLENLEVIDHLPLEKRSTILITGGANVGKKGVILEIKGQKAAHKELVQLEVREEKIQAPEKYVFVIGRKEPLITMLGD